MMKEKDLQIKVMQVIKEIEMTGEFIDRIEIIKWILSLIYLYNIQEYKLISILKDQDHSELWTWIHSISVLRTLDDNTTRKYDFIDFLCQGFFKLLPDIKKDKINVMEILIDSTSMVNMGKQGVPFEPENLSKLIALIAKEEGMTDVFDPFAGISSFAIKDDFKNIKYSGFEINPDLAFISNLRLGIYGKEMNVEIKNSISCWNDISFPSGIVTYPPYGLPINDDFNELNTCVKKAEEFIVEQFIENDHIEKAIFLLPLRITSSYDMEKIFKFLVDFGMIKMIISLPKGALYESSIYSAILVLDKTNHEERETITFVSLHDCFEKMDNRRPILNFELSKERILGRNNQFVRKIKIEEIQKRFYELNPGKYLLDFVLPVISSTAHKAPVSAYLKRIDMEVKSNKLGEPTEIIGINDLYDDYEEAQLPLKANTKNYSRFYEINEDAIIIGYNGNNLKFGKVFKKDGIQKISNKLIAYKIDLDINVDYLILELSKKYIQDQIKLLGIDSVWKDTFDIIREIIFVCEKREIQNNVVNKVKEKLIGRIYSDIIDVKNDFRRDVHMKRHAIGQSIGALNNWWGVLENIKNCRKNSIDDNATALNMDIKLGDVLHNIKNIIKRISTQVDKLDRGFNYTPDYFNLWEFIQEYKDTHKTPIFEYEIQFPDSFYLEGIGFCFNFPEDNNEFNSIIFFPREVLNIILNNILSNASSHGFGNSYNKGNLVRIILYGTPDNLILTISNNGVPFAEDMTVEKLLSYGETTNNEKHCGIGGYETNYLMNEFGGKLEVKLDKTSDFPVEYQLIFKRYKNEE